jgi:hypothetical protein
MYEGEDEPVGVLGVDIDGDVFEFDVNENYTGALPFFLRYPDMPMEMGERVKMWVLDRAPDVDYEFIDALIEKVGLKTYDAYGFFKYNGGKFIRDRFYVLPYAEGG